MTPIARGTCGHEQAEPGYKPSRKLQHLVRVRNARCTAPGCGRSAARCDLDHTIAWHQGGLTSNAVWPRCAGIIIAVSRPKDGGWSSLNRASWSGTPRPGAPIPPHPTEYPA